MNFEEIHQRYRRKVEFFFMGRGYSHDQVDDLTQITFFRVSEGLEAFRGDSGCATWIQQIATNVWLNDRREAKAQKRDGIDVPIEDERNPAQPRYEVEAAHRGGPNPEAAVAAREQGERLNAAIAQLPPRGRQCLLLWVGGYRYQEIADLLTITLGAVKSHLHQAKTRLRQLLDGAPDSPE